MVAQLKSLAQAHVMQLLFLNDASRSQPLQRAPFEGSKPLLNRVSQRKNFIIAFCPCLGSFVSCHWYIPHH